MVFDFHLIVYACVVGYAKKQIMLREKHDQLIIQAKMIMGGLKDTPTKLKKLIHSYFPDLSDFHVNWRCSTMEDNSLITLAARYSHLKCLTLLVEQFNSSLELCDVGGFTPLILCAYNGSFECVRYCIKKGANASVCGRYQTIPHIIIRFSSLWMIIECAVAVCCFQSTGRFYGSMTRSSSTFEPLACDKKARTALKLNRYFMLN